MLLYVTTVSCVHAISLRSSAQEGNLLRFNPQDSHLPGFSMELIRLLHQTDPQLLISGQDRFRSLRRLEADLDSGKIDMVVGMEGTVARRQRFMVITRPVLYVQHVALAVRQDDALLQLPADGMQGLGRYGIVAVAQGSAYAAYLSTPGGGQADDGAIAITGNLGKLMRHRVRFVLHAEEELGWHIQQLRLQPQIRLIPVPLARQDVCLILSRRLPASTVRHLRAVLQRLERSGSLTALRAKYGLKGRPQQPSRRVLPVRRQGSKI